MIERVTSMGKSYQDESNSEYFKLYVNSLAGSIYGLLQSFIATALEKNND